MYVPRDFALEDRGELLAFLEEHPFGMLVSASDGEPRVTHIPLTVLRSDDEIVLGAHVARANSHWRDLEGARVLAVFQGAHGYVSPRWYEDPRHSVPTWNYDAVHCQGIAHLCDSAQTDAILEALVERMEGAGGWQIADADPAYIASLRGGIVAFEIAVQNITGKRKRSQNRSEEDRRRVAEAFAGDAFQLDHVQLAMPAGRERDARAFYIGTLGFEEVPKPPELAQRGGAWFRRGHVRLHIGVDSQFIPARKAHPAIACTNYRALVASCEASGVEVARDPLPFQGREHCYVADPFGNRIELIEAGHL